MSLLEVGVYIVQDILQLRQRQVDMLPPVGHTLLLLQVDELVEVLQWEPWSIPVSVAVAVAVAVIVEIWTVKSLRIP